MSLITAADFLKWLEFYNVQWGTSGPITIPVPVSQGGTGNTTATAYGLIAGGTTTTAHMQSLAVGSSGQILQSGGASALPAWSTSTYPATNEINTLLYASAANTMSALATANNGMLVTSAGGVPSIGNSVGADCYFNSVRIGKGNSGISSCTVIGNGSGGSMTNSSAECTGVGYQVLTTANALTGETVFGWKAGNALTSGGDRNSFFGGNCGVVCSSSPRNAGFGSSALSALNGGSGYNAAFGYTAGSTITSGSYNTCLGQAADVSAVDAVGCLALGSGAVATKATGATSADSGPGVALGSSTYKVGFRGDGSIYPSTTGAGFWRPKINGTAYMIPLITDGASAWPAITTTSINFSSTSGIIGTTTNDSAAAGSVGEILESAVSSGGTVTSETNRNAQTLSVTAGDWLIWGVYILAAGTTGLTRTIAGLNTTSATLPSFTPHYEYRNSLSPSYPISCFVAPTHFQLASTTTIYLVGLSTFSGGSSTIGGKIYAQRIR